MPIQARVLERYPTHLDRLAAAVVRLYDAGRDLLQALDDVSESEALTELGRRRMGAKVQDLLTRREHANASNGPAIQLTNLGRADGG